MRTMGIDLGTRKIAYAIWEDGVLVEADTLEAHDYLPRQNQLLEIGDWIYEAAQNTEPDQIFIEDTLVGNNVKYSIKLAQVMGATLASLALISMEQVVDILLVNNKVWKKDVLGNGNAGKELIQNYVKSLSPAYSVICGSDQDRYDAACVGLYGERLRQRADLLVP